MKPETEEETTMQRFQKVGVLMEASPPSSTSP